MPHPHRLDTDPVSETAAPADAPVELGRRGMETAESGGAPRGWIDIIGSFWSTLLDEAGRRWWLYIAVGAACLALTLAWIHSADETYEVSMTLGPSDTGITANLSSGISLPGGSGLLGSLAGLAQNSEMTPYQRYPFFLQSLEVAEVLAQDMALMRTVFPGQWDESTGTWRRPVGGMTPLKDAIKDLLRMPGWTAPDARAMRDFIRRNIRIRKNNMSGVQDITFSADDPVFAQTFLARLHRTAIERMKATDRERVDARVAYLVQVISDARAVDNREALGQLLAAEHQRRMTLTVDPNYGIMVLERHSVPPMPVWPRPQLMIALGIMLTGGLWVAIFVIARQVDAYRAARPVKARRPRRKPRAGARPSPRPVPAGALSPPPDTGSRAS